MNLQEYGYLRVAAAVPEIKLADPAANLEEIKRLISQAVEAQAEVLVFPELTTTGYSAGDLFHQSLLTRASDEAITDLVESTHDHSLVVILGAPCRLDNQLFSAAFVIQQGEIKAIIPKQILSRQAYQARWFSPAPGSHQLIDFHGQSVPFGRSIQLVHSNSHVRLAIELGDSLACEANADVILQLSASPEIAGHFVARRDHLRYQSLSRAQGYVYVSSSPTDSTSDVIYSGHAIIGELDEVLAEERLRLDSHLIWADIDIDRLRYAQLQAMTGSKAEQDLQLEFARDDNSRTIDRSFSAHPFIPQRDSDTYYEEILKLQAIGLSQRLNKIGVKNSHIGISGGLDSTWALIVVKTAYEMAGLPLDNIKGITMPGFGTTDDTKANAYELMEALGLKLREIDIQAVVLQHFEDIGHDPKDTQVVYENAQARERTQILMDLANKEQGIVIGTGDLSENALGWSTYNGDHMSMYSLNASLPKTLIRAILKWYADRCDDRLKQVLYAILQTPISPELLPPDASGEIAQKTEDIIGDYSLNDFFLYHVITNGYEPKKIILLAELAFGEVYPREELIDSLKNFYRRFITNQFKRNTAPDAPQVTSIGLSARGDFKLVSDATFTLWLAQLEKMEENL